MNDLQDLDCKLKAAGTSLEVLSRTADCVVLFGSRSARVDRNGSDWDLLCVGDGKTRKSPSLDLVWIAPKRIHSIDWRRSELAGHVATFGTVLSGDFTWRATVERSDDPAVRKATRLSLRVRILTKDWTRLAVAFRQKHIRFLSNDLVRLAFLSRHEAVPPTPILESRHEKLSEIAKEQSENGVLSFEIRDQFLLLKESLDGTGCCLKSAESIEKAR